jgi:hypothetical protein
MSGIWRRVRDLRVGLPRVGLPGARLPHPRMPRARLPHGAMARRAWRVARIGMAMVVASVLLAVGAFASTTLYGMYGGPRTEGSTLAWADRAAVYASGNCRECHDAQATTVAAGSHGEVICETCHIPTVSHPGPVSGVVQALDTETSAVCTTCHAEASGRSIRFPQVDPADHYRGALCLQCHDPHSALADTPPAVTHPLAKLPDCTTCHSPEGLKRFPTGHQLAPDVVCLGCHRTTARVP